MNCQATHQFRPSSRQGGESLVEVLVSLLVFSIGLMALASLQVKSLQRNIETKHISQASRAAQVIEAEIQLNPSGFANTVLHSDQLVQLSACSIDQDCSPRQRAESAFRDSVAAIKDQLPSLTALVCQDASPEDGTASSPACDGGPQLAIKLWWGLETDSSNQPNRLIRSVAAP